jgi:DNA polymerase III epsilon subunit-like protein
MKLLIIDTETNNVHPEIAHIMEVAIASLDFENGDISLLLDTPIYPECPEELWENCWFMKHSGLDPDIILGAPVFSSIADMVSELLKIGPVTAFNLSFDLSVLKREGVAVPFVAPCLMRITKDILRLPGLYNDWKYPKFSEAWSHFFPGQPFEEKHRAGHDAVHEAKLAFVLYQEGYFGQSWR